MRKFILGILFTLLVLILGVAGFARSLAERGLNGAEDGPGDPLLRTPITGIAFCWARSEPDAAIAAPASSAISTRRFITR